MKMNMITCLLTALLSAVAGGVYAASDVCLSVSDAPDPARVGSVLTYTVNVTNEGPEAAADVEVNDLLPDGVSFESASTTLGTCTQQEDVVTFSIGSMAQGESCELTVSIVPQTVGVLTNKLSLTGDTEIGNNRQSEITEVLMPNHPPQFNFAAGYNFPALQTGQVAVTVSDPDHDPLVTITNGPLPAGAVYVEGTFSWMPDISDAGTTTTVFFVADDHQGETNSVATNIMTVIVPPDGDEDGLDDAWEWDSFATLTNTASADTDGDGASNYAEYIAGTQPESVASAFRLLPVVQQSDGTTREITFTTCPGRKYIIEYADEQVAGQWQWTLFGSQLNDVGTWTETNTVSSMHTLVDDQSPATTGCAPVHGRRLYRICVEVQ